MRVSTVANTRSNGFTSRFPPISIKHTVHVEAMLGRVDGGEGEGVAVEEV
jgi:hypothetical protein